MTPMQPSKETSRRKGTGAENGSAGSYPARTSKSSSHIANCPGHRACYAQ